MADKIRMNFQAVDEMIDVLQGAHDNLDEIYKMVNDCQTSIQNGALAGRSGEALRSAFERMTQVTGFLGYYFDALKDDVKKARDEMAEATKAGSFSSDQGDA